MYVAALSYSLIACFLHCGAFFHTDILVKPNLFYGLIFNTYWVYLINCVKQGLSLSFSIWIINCCSTIYWMVHSSSFLYLLLIHLQHRASSHLFIDMFWVHHSIGLFVLLWANTTLYQFWFNEAGKKKQRFSSQTAEMEILPLLTISFVPLNELLNLPVPWISYL